MSKKFKRAKVEILPGVSVEPGNWEEAYIPAERNTPVAIAPADTIPIPVDEFERVYKDFLRTVKDHDIKIAENAEGRLGVMNLIRAELVSKLAAAGTQPVNEGKQWYCKTIELTHTPLNSVLKWCERILIAQNLQAVPRAADEMALSYVARVLVVLFNRMQAAQMEVLDNKEHEAEKDAKIIGLNAEIETTTREASAEIDRLKAEIERLDRKLGSATDKLNLHEGLAALAPSTPTINNTTESIESAMHRLLKENEELTNQVARLALENRDFKSQAAECDPKVIGRLEGQIAAYQNTIQQMLANRR